MPEVKFTAQSYLEAAQEHLSASRRLHEAAFFFQAHYLAGLAVECILRAHARQADDTFTGRHDLSQLAAQGGFFSLARGEKQIEYDAKLNEINLRWRSNQRYMTETQLLSYLNNTRLDWRVRGDRLKYNSKRMYNLAEDVVGLGVLKWKNG